MTKEALIKLGVENIVCKGETEHIATVFSAHYVAHAGDKTYEGHDFLYRWTKQMLTSIDNIKVVKIKILSQDENTLTWQRTLTGVHIKALRSIPASNKKITWTEMVVSRFKDGKIAEEWLVSELAAALLLKQPKKP
ncbi:ester cyclase [Flagellimonas flava]|uniref:SnoaL-like polyketide cyclase n=1 Tax=Flagellimonas flava TaxID=570519 RepID=A0A1M5P6I8_9FLAO|nr:ester cyclase [Allomuricauda flava]SHG97368.1 SnoaL-like polyketide cyclase [Allomuricauda flava]